jgi:hypothetical protein
MILEGLDYYFDKMLDDYLEGYFSDAENEQECLDYVYVGEDD